MLIHGATMCVAVPLDRQRFGRHSLRLDVYSNPDLDRVKEIRRQLTTGVYDIESRLDACLDLLGSDLQLSSVCV